MGPRLDIKGARADGVRSRMKHDIAAATASPYGWVGRRCSAALSPLGGEHAEHLKMAGCLIFKKRLKINFSSRPNMPKGNGHFTCSRPFACRAGR
jgi:hypothetical protein